MATTEQPTDSDGEPPLFKLPAELRNRIYEDVLGGQKIPIRIRPFHQRSVVSSICRFDDHNSSIENRDRDDPKCRFLDEEVCYKHNACFDEPDRLNVQTHVATNLLQTCRQIHDEAALIPFTDNMFIVHNHDLTPRSFASLLSRKQRSAITHLDLHLTPGYPGCQAKQFPNLRSLALHMDFHDHTTAGPYHNLAITFPMLAFVTMDAYTEQRSLELGKGFVIVKNMNKAYEHIRGDLLGDD